MPYIPPSSLSTTFTRSAAFRYGRHNSEPVMPSTESFPPPRHHRSPSLNIPLSGDKQGFVSSIAVKEDEEEVNLSSYPWRPVPGHEDLVTQTGIPVGAILSPTESRNNSSEDDDKEGAGDRLPHAVLHSALAPEFSAAITERLNTHQKFHSPPESPKCEPPLQSSLRGSRTTPHTPEESETEVDFKPKKMVRKKSGELVRPALRAKQRPASVPGTPTYSKAVHFDANLEHIRHFLQVDKPTAVSADTSPVDYYDGDTEFPFGVEKHDDEDSDKEVPAVRPQPGFEWDAKVANFPAHPEERRDMSVRLERIFLTPDNKNLVGVVSVANLAFEKHVIARFTFDYWKTTSEVVAEFNPDVSRRKKQTVDGIDYDRFDFSISLADQANLQSRQLFVCIRYCVDGQEYWDNNSRMNYNINFTRRYNGRGGRLHAEKHSLGAPRSKRSVSVADIITPPPGWSDFSATDGEKKANPPRSRPRQSIFSKNYAFNSKLPGNATRSEKVDCVAPEDDLPLKLEEQDLTNTSNGDVKKGPSVRRGNGKAFATRYDFGASLSAAMQPSSTEKSEPGESGTPQIPMPSLILETSDATKKDSQLNEHSEAAKDVPAKTSDGDKPYHQSALYRELVDRYCFYGTQKPTQTSPTPTPNGAKGTQQGGSNTGIGSGPAAPVSAYLNLRLPKHASRSNSPVSGPPSAGLGPTSAPSHHIRTASPLHLTRADSPISRTSSPFSPVTNPSPPLTASVAHSPNVSSIFGDQSNLVAPLPLALPSPLLSESSPTQTAIQG